MQLRKMKTDLGVKVARRLVLDDYMEHERHPKEKEGKIVDVVRTSKARKQESRIRSMTVTEISRDTHKHSYHA